MHPHKFGKKEDFDDREFDYAQVKLQVDHFQKSNTHDYAYSFENSLDDNLITMVQAFLLPESPCSEIIKNADDYQLSLLPSQ